MLCSKEVQDKQKESQRLTCTVCIMVISMLHQFSYENPLVPVEFHWCSMHFHSPKSATWWTCRQIARASCPSWNPPKRARWCHFKHSQCREAWILADFQPSDADYGDVLVNFERKLAVRLVESSNVCRFFGIALPGEGPTEFETWRRAVGIVALFQHFTCGKSNDFYLPFADGWVPPPMKILWCLGCFLSGWWFGTWLLCFH